MFEAAEYKGINLAKLVDKWFSNVDDIEYHRRFCDYTPARITWFTNVLPLGDVQLAFIEASLKSNSSIICTSDRRICIELTGTYRTNFEVITDNTPTEIEEFILILKLTYPELFKT